MLNIRIFKDNRIMSLYLNVSSLCVVEWIVYYKIKIFIPENMGLHTTTFNWLLPKRAPESDKRDWIWKNDFSKLLSYVSFSVMPLLWVWWMILINFGSFCNLTLSNVTILPLYDSWRHNYFLNIWLLPVWLCFK